MAGRVAWTVDNFQLQLADSHGIAAHQPAVRLERFARQAIAARGIIEALDPEPVAFVRAFDRHAQIARQHAGHPAVIHVAMGDEQFLDRHTGLLDGQFQPVEIAACVDESTAHGFRAPDQGAVLLKSRHRNDRGTHRGLAGIGHDLCFGVSPRFGQAGLRSYSRPLFHTTRPTRWTSPAATSIGR